MQVPCFERVGLDLWVPESNPATPAVRIGAGLLASEEDESVPPYVVLYLRSSPWYLCRGF